MAAHKRKVLESIGMHMLLDEDGDDAIPVQFPVALKVVIFLILILDLFDGENLELRPDFMNLAQWRVELRNTRRRSNNASSKQQSRACY